MGKNAKWTEAAAARRAREMRIETVAFLQNSPEARMFELAHLHNEIDMSDLLSRSPAAALDETLRTKGYAPPFPTTGEGLKAFADRIVDDQATHLAGAELYIIEPSMADVAVAAALTLTDDDLGLLDPSDLPSPTGAVIWPEPLLVRDFPTHVTGYRAFAWHTPARWHAADQVDLDGVRITGYVNTYGPAQPPEIKQYLAERNQQLPRLPPLLPAAGLIIPFHTSLGDPDVRRRYRNAVTNHAQRVNDFPNESEADYEHGAVLENTDTLLSVKLLYAFWRLCEQRIAAKEVAPVNHSAKVTAERSGVSPELTIVRLRRASQPAASDKQAGHDWQHRWIVRMHKVRQWYPNTQQHKILYRGPYIKGPAGKPLLSTETVRALVR